MEHRLAVLARSLHAALARRPHLEIDGQPLIDMLVAEYAAEPPGAVDDGVAEIVDHFGLTALDGDLLTVAAAVDLDARFGAAYALVQGADRWTPAVGLALELCGQGSLSPSARERLDESGALRRRELVTVEGTGTALLRSVSAPARVVTHLLGGAAPEPQIAAALREIPARRDGVADRVAAAFKSGARLVHVRERPGTSGLASARGALEQLGLDALVVDAARIATESPRRLVRLAVREAGLVRCGLVLTGLDAPLVADRGVLVELEGAPLPIVLVDDLAWASGWYRGPVLDVDATPLTLAERAETWRAALAPDQAHEVDGAEWRNLVGLRMTPEHIASAIGSAAVTAAADRVEVTIQHLHDAAREQGRVRLEGAGVRTVPQATLDDLILPSSTRQALDELVSWARNRETLLATGRLTGRGTKGHGLTALFAGSPGTGKTLAAEAVAGELGLELCTVDLSLVIDKYIGETEKHLEQVISEAENLNVVLFFDEADSLFGSRSAVSDARDRYANQEVAYLLQRIERFEGLAVLATNLRGNLDAAFARRLHHVITFTDPDAETRRALWDAHLAEAPAYDEGDPLDLDWLVESVELTGGDIRNIVMTAAFAATAEPSAVGMRHLLYAVEREYRKQAKRMPALP